MQVSTVAIFITLMVISSTTAAPQGQQFADTFGFDQRQLPPTETRTPVPILSMTQVRDEAGQFAYRYQTGDGQGFSEQGALKRGEDPTSSYYLVKQGSYSYVAPDGTPIQVSYVADENGFRPVGSHFPKAPVPH